jgi:uncharacterized protein (TIGR00304 family)
MVAFSLIILGLTLTAVGTVMLLLSLRLDKRESKSEHRGLGVILIGPIPFIFGGVRKAFMVVFALVALLVILGLAVSTNPSVIGW